LNLNFVGIIKTVKILRVFEVLGVIDGEKGFLAEIYRVPGCVWRGVIFKEKG